MSLPGTITVADASRGPWDAVVVGAGPAGSVVARELARNGLKVLIVDKAQFPRRKVCGCCLNAAAIDSLERLGLGTVLRDAVPLSGVCLATAGRFANVRLPGGVALSREMFDAALIREAMAEGAEFLPGISAKLGPCERDFRTVQLGEVAVRARVVVAADGLAGGVTSADGNAAVVREAARIGAGTVADHGPSFYTPGTVFMAVSHGGYVGLVRLEDGRLDVAAAFDPVTIREHGGLGPAAVRVLGHSGFPPVAGLETLPWKGTPALTRHAARVAGDRWFAVGDAAGYVEPFTGEGMAWAVAGAAALAPIAARATNWNPRSADKWTAAHARVVRQRQGICRAAAWVLRSPTLCRLSVTALSLAPRLAGPVVGRLNRPRPAP